MTTKVESGGLKLWNKNFIILIMGSIVSSIGSSLLNFALGLYILDKTNTITYGIFMGVTVLTKLLVVFIGPIIDRHSRRKAIYRIDILLAAIFISMGIFIKGHGFNLLVFYIFSLSLSFIMTIYETVYNSFFPDVIPKGSFSKAYSISSLVFPLAQVVSMLCGLILYNTIGIYNIFFLAAGLFFVTAIIEWFIKAQETVDRETKGNFIEDFSKGIKYLKEERGIRSIYFYFFFSTMSNTAVYTMLMPYFKSNPFGATDGLNMVQYTYIVTITVVGRLVGGIVHYGLSIPTRHKFKVALIVYLIVDLFAFITFNIPFPILMAVKLLQGLLGVTSFNIRMSTTQHYIPGKMLGRLNGIFSFITIIGHTIASITSAYIAQYWGFAMVGYIYGGFAFIAVLLIIVRNRKHISLIYNREV